MFKVIKNPEFKAPVKVMAPADGGQREYSFTATFRALTRSEEQGYDALNAASTDDFLRRIIVGWSGLEDEDGTPFAFSTANLNTLIDLHYVRMALVQAYTSAISGAKSPRRGN